MKDRRRKKSSAHWDSNPQPFDHETMLLPNQLKVFLKNASHRKSEHFLKEAFFIIAVKLQKKWPSFVEELFKVVSTMT